VPCPDQHFFFITKNIPGNMKRSTKILLTIAAILVGGAIFWNLDTTAAIGKTGSLVGIITMAAIYGIWRWDSEGADKNKGTK
jgi:hypothetical protein